MILQIMIENRISLHVDFKFSIKKTRFIYLVSQLSPFMNFHRFSKRSIYISTYETHLHLAGPCVGSRHHCLQLPLLSMCTGGNLSLTCFQQKNFFPLQSTCTEVMVFIHCVQNLQNCADRSTIMLNQSYRAKFSKLRLLIKITIQAVKHCIRTLST